MNFVINLSRLTTSAYTISYRGFGSGMSPPFNFKLWELRRSRTTAAVSLVSVRSLTYVASLGKKEKVLYVLSFVCWFWHEIFSVQSSINLSSVCCLTLFMNLHLLSIVCVSQKEPRFRLKVNVFTCVVQFSISILSSPKRQLYAFCKMWLSGKAMRRAQYFRVWTCCFSKRGKWPVSPYMARVGVCLLTPSMFFLDRRDVFSRSHFALYLCIIFQSHTWE